MLEKQGLLLDSSLTINHNNSERPGRLLPTSPPMPSRPCLQPCRALSLRCLFYPITSAMNFFRSPTVAVCVGLMCLSTADLLPEDCYHVLSGLRLQILRGYASFFCALPSYSLPRLKSRFIRGELLSHNKPQHPGNDRSYSATATCLMNAR